MSISFKLKTRNSIIKLLKSAPKPNYPTCKPSYSNLGIAIFLFSMFLFLLEKFAVDSVAFCQLCFYRAMHYIAKRGLAIACCLSVGPSVRPSVTLVDCDHIGWKSWKLIARTISPTPSLFVAAR